MKNELMVKIKTIYYDLSIELEEAERYKEFADYTEEQHKEFADCKTILIKLREITT